MHRKLFLLAGVGIISWTTGCCMCDAPYDYCGPTFLGGPCGECVTDARMNSVFNPYPTPYAAGPIIEGPDGPIDQPVLQQTNEPPAPPNATPDVEAPAPAPVPAAPPMTLPRSTTQAPRARSVSTPR